MWVLYVLIILLAVVFIALCIPIDLIFKFNTAEFSKRKIQLHLLWGLVRYDLRGAGKKEKPKPAGVKHPKKKRGLDPAAINEILRIRGLYRRVWKFLSDIFKSFKIKQLNADIALGPEDPVYYGYLIAFTIPINYLLSRTSHHVVINPVFEGQYVFQCISNGQARVYPVKLAAAAVAFMFSSTCFKLLRIMVSAKWI